MFITAPLIHNGHCFMPEGTTISINEGGIINEILTEPAGGTLHYEGILVPGFINTHCHLELSHMQGTIQEHTGLVPFLKNVTLKRNEYTGEQKSTARQTAYNSLINNGIVAVGDIANTTDSLGLRLMDKLHFHTFIEALGFSDIKAARSFGYALGTFEAFAAQGQGKKILRQTITPHAPYSVSAALFRAIDSHNEQGILSIHNQESEEENKYYRVKEGGITDLLGTMGIDDNYFKPTGLSSLQSYMEWLTPGRQYIFVHNTFTSIEDIQYIKARINSAYWCLCPNANLYIENRLPDINMLLNEGVNICIGTDSLASNHQLCILSELLTIKENYPAINWETLLSWGTCNGARALQMQDTLGTIEPGKQPGIVQLTGIGEAEKPVIKRVV